MAVAGRACGAQAQHGRAALHRSAAGCKSHAARLTSGRSAGTRTRERLVVCAAQQNGDSSSGSNGAGPAESREAGSQKGAKAEGGAVASVTTAAERAGISMGPIALSFGQASPIAMSLGGEVRERAIVDEDEAVSRKPVVRLNSLSTEEWQKKYVKDDDTIDLWIEEDYNAASRMPAGREYGSRENVAWSGTETSDSDVAVHTIKIKAHDSDNVITVTSPADRYVLFEAEEQGLDLPSACRMGCCTVCAVKVKSGTITQPQALGLSAGMKAQGYALLCVGYAQSDLEVELQDPDEVYDLQFGSLFEEQATDKNARTVLRDDFALELATGDE